MAMGTRGRSSRGRRRRAATPHLSRRGSSPPPRPCAVHRGLAADRTPAAAAGSLSACRDQRRCARRRELGQCWPEPGAGKIVGTSARAGFCACCSADLGQAPASPVQRANFGRLRCQAGLGVQHASSRSLRTQLFLEGKACAPRARLLRRISNSLGHPTVFFSFSFFDPIPRRCRCQPHCKNPTCNHAVGVPGIPAPGGPQAPPAVQRGQQARSSAGQADRMRRGQ